VKGVINLRGQVISVVDLRAKFCMQEAIRTEQTCIVVVDINREGRRVNIGVIVDRVSEVLNIAEDNTEDAPAFGGGIDTSFIRGMGKIGSSVKILLDIDKVLNAASDVVVLEPAETAEPSESAT
jgi:purine-binding chemotaxis protein CheW